MAPAQPGWDWRRCVAFGVGGGAVLWFIFN